MKKTTILKASLLVLSGTLITFNAISYGGGSPGQKNGAPSANGTTCATSCHTGGTVTNETVSITTDIPTTGFLSNTEYNITVTGNNGGGTSVKAGFEVSIEDMGSYVGSISSINSNTKLVALNNNLITHSSAKTLSSGMTSWTFKWNSGSAPTGTQIYAAINFVNGDGTSSGDVVAKSDITISKNTIGMEENWVNNLEVFPNPAQDEINIMVDFIGLSNAEIVIYDFTGKRVKELYNNKVSGHFQDIFDVSDLESGVYILSLNADGNTKHQKLIIQ